MGVASGRRPFVVFAPALVNNGWTVGEQWAVGVASPIPFCVMRVAPSSFVSGAADAAELLSSLRETGFELTSTQATFTVLDTIDGRLYRHGMRMVATRLGSGPSVTLSLSDNGTIHGAVSTDTLPIRASGLPRSSMHDALAAVTGERLLLAQATVVAAHTVATRRNSDGELRALVTIDDRLRLAGRRKPLASTATVHRVAGKGTARRRAEALCMEAGFASSSGDVFGELLDAAGVVLHGASRSPGDEFGDSTTALAGLRVVLTQLFVAVEGYWRGALDSPDPAFVHGLRVATRRSRSVLVEGKSALPREALNAANTGLGHLGTSTGHARDLDVYLAEWDGYMSPFSEETVAALGPLKALLEERRRVAHEDLAISLRSPAMKNFVREWGKWLRKPVANRSLARSPDSERDLREFVVERIEHAHLTLLENGRLITDESPATQVHDLRRDAKRLRHLLECFSALLPAKATKRFVRRLKSLQDNLGAHQDAEVHAAQLAVLMLHDDAQHLPEVTVVAMGALVGHLEQQCRAERKEFSSRFVEYDSPTTQDALGRILIAESI